MKCKFEHDGDCCNSGATQYMCKCKQPCDTIIPETNADRIRAMSDEELAERLDEWQDWGGGLGKEWWLEWLKQPAGKDGV